MSPQPLLMLPHREPTVRSKILKSTPAESVGRGGKALIIEQTIKLSFK